jgi:O-antigen/teichoic acid export membrane protein
MSPTVLFLVATGLVGFCAVLMRGTAPYSGEGGSDYEKRKTRRLLGILLLVAGAICFGIALLAQFFSNRS